MYKSKEDDRTPEQKRDLPFIVLMTDTFMSGWDCRGGRPNYAGWACSSKKLRDCEEWVRSRCDSKNVRVVGADYKPPSRVDCHIYVNERWI